MYRRIARILLILLLTPPLMAAAMGWLVAPSSFLHPVRRTLIADLIRQADVSFAQIGVHREPFDVRAPDGVLLHGWKICANQPNGSWVLLFHGVADNRIGVLEHALVLLRAGYSVTMMDARAHGQSEGGIATYGWLERKDISAILDALVASEHPAHIFALGESMGAGIALQSAAADPRIEAVVAESSLRQPARGALRLRRPPEISLAWQESLCSRSMLARGPSLASFSAADVSPERAVAARPFPVLLICDSADTTLPCRHSQKIYAAARGPKSLWIVPGAFHTAAIGYQPIEFRYRVLHFFAEVGASAPL
jgi:uncharacterized protein